MDVQKHYVQNEKKTHIFSFFFHAGEFCIGCRQSRVRPLEEQSRPPPQLSLTVMSELGATRQMSERLSADPAGPPTCQKLQTHSLSGGGPLSLWLPSPSELSLSLCVSCVWQLATGPGDYCTQKPRGRLPQDNSGVPVQRWPSLLSACWGLEPTRDRSLCSCLGHF